MIRPATRDTAVLIPEAMPECRSSAAAMTVAVTGATTRVSPSRRIARAHWRLRALAYAMTTLAAITATVAPTV